jgi:hypothetical protein
VQLLPALSFLGIGHEHEIGLPGMRGIGEGGVIGGFFLSDFGELFLGFLFYLFLGFG